MVYQWNMSQIGYADLEGRSGFKLAVRNKAGGSTSMSRPSGSRA